MRYRFAADFELDEAVWELRRAGRRVAIGKRPLELLVTLLRNRHCVLSATELRQLLWPDVTVSDASLATCLKELRHALDDDGSSQRVIRTLRGKGYRFVAPVREIVGHAPWRPGRELPDPT